MAIAVVDVAAYWLIHCPNYCRSLSAEWTI